MEPQHGLPDHDQRCEPEWVALNHLFSYCAKARPPRIQSGTGSDQDPPTQRCARNTCLFNAARK